MTFLPKCHDFPALPSAGRDRAGHGFARDDPWPAATDPLRDGRHRPRGRRSTSKEPCSSRHRKAGVRELTCGPHVTIYAS
jgi:hypothetical protein